MTDEGDPDRASWVNNLGLMLESRYERTGAVTDLEEAIGMARQAVAATPDDDPDRAASLSNLGHQLSVGMNALQPRPTFVLQAGGSVIA